MPFDSESSGADFSVGCWRIAIGSTHAPRMDSRIARNIPAEVKEAVRGKRETSPLSG